MRWRELLGVRERRWKKAPDEEVQPAKTLWDWLQLLVVPAILIAVTFAWSAAQTRASPSSKVATRRTCGPRGLLEQRPSLGGTAATSPAAPPPRRRRRRRASRRFRRAWSIR